MNFIFDLDGTLIDSSARHYALLEKLLDEFHIDGQNYSGEKYLQYKRNGGNTVGYLKDELAVDDSTARIIAKQWIERIEDLALIKQYDILYPDSLVTLTRLKTCHRIIFLSGRQKAGNAQKELDCLGIAGFADDIAICDPQNAINNKTDYILNNYKNLENTVLIGDTEVEYATAQKCGCASYLLSRGFRSKEFWDQRGIESHENLLDLNFTTK